MRHYLNYLLLAIVLLCGGGLLRAQEVQVCDVKNPEVGDRNTTTVEISRVECTPEATTLYMEAYNRRQYWMQLDSVLHLHGAVTGRDYPLRRCEGLALGQHVYMPDSGNVSFRLVFPPLDGRDTSFDFMEGGKDGWFIKGVNLKEEREGKLHCRLTGTVEKPTEASRLVLHRYGLDARVKPFISIPVHNGKFEYDLYTDCIEAWQLYLWHDWMEGLFYWAKFLSENATLHITFPERGRPKVETDGTENRLMQDVDQRAENIFSPKYEQYNARVDTLESEDDYFTPAGKDLYERLRATEMQEEANKIYKQLDSLKKSRRLYLPRMMALQDSLSAYRAEEKSWRLREAARKPSVVGLSFLRFELDDSDHPDSLKQALWAVYDSVYAGYLPGHPYHAVVDASRLFRTLAEGQPYPDYEITGDDGRPLRMSGLIRGKIALVDLWASWCGPCRANSKSMIPVYEEFKDKGFTVVGIAREKRRSDMEQAVRKDGYPWACYAEVEDANNVWALHGIGNSGGGTFLVDSDGTLLAVGASADEVREILRKKLGGKSGH